jgi:hypothetical protein
MNYADSVELIRQTMHSRGVDRQVAQHSVQRIAALVRPEEIVLCDAGLSDEPADDFTGKVVVFTATRVIVADLGSQEGDDDLDRVSARAWRRSALDLVEILGSDNDWEPSNPEGTLPSGSGLRLSYGPERVVELPLKKYSAPDGLDSLLDSLAADLAAP